ncbi:hypothetical protein V6N11_062356 [Hibiscus sabdariffa]|uniref:Multiprotein bridging factor 1 N-terminal domain-containing protein n=1 Tax=Hibiscus sabdariffa TaxID=183260 RepID=A0ABR2PSB8_9ROSI
MKSLVNFIAGILKGDLSKPKSQDLRHPKAVNQALQTIKKFDAGSNKKAVGPVVYTSKLDKVDEPATLDRLSTDVSQAIQKGRVEKKMSKAELAKQINEQLKVVHVEPNK